MKKQKPQKAKKTAPVQHDFQLHSSRHNFEKPSALDDEKIVHNAEGPDPETLGERADFF